MGTESDSVLSPSQDNDLRRIAAIMIPADPETGLPSAGDPMIIADILATLGRETQDIRAALDALAHTAFAELNDARAEAIALQFLAERSRPASTLGRVVLQSYYRDDRVLRILGHEPGPPFPKGHALEQGDWSLLDTIKHRPPFWRDDRRI